MKTMVIRLNTGDIEDWLNDGNEEGPELYRAEVEKRLAAAYPETQVDVILDDGYSTRYEIDGWSADGGNNDEIPVIDDIIAELGNDWSWYPEAA